MIHFVEGSVLLRCSFASGGEQRAKTAIRLREARRSHDWVERLGGFEFVNAIDGALAHLSTEMQIGESMVRQGEGSIQVTGLGFADWRKRSIFAEKKRVVLLF